MPADRNESDSRRIAASMRHERRYGHRSCVLWFTGLSGAGKTTLANAVEARLHEMGLCTYVLDGDLLRRGLNRNLGFSPEDRSENIRRAAETAKLFVDAGLIVAAAFISPYRADRMAARRLFLPGEFIEIYVKCPAEVCARRDPKGLYALANQGEIPQFTGITAPYEEPEQPEIVVETNRESKEAATRRIVAYLNDTVLRA